jgi:hypothetical protein
MEDNIQTAAGRYYYSNCVPAYFPRLLYYIDGVTAHSFAGVPPLLTSQELANSLKLRSTILVIPPFRIEKYGQIFINRHELFINTEEFTAGLYKVVVVHNFQVEDCNPNLRECTAGIFFACQIHSGWEEPEAYPIECRSIEALAYIDTGSGEILHL